MQHLAALLGIVIDLLEPGTGPSRVRLRAGGANRTFVGIRCHAVVVGPPAIIGVIKP
jgi:hypothetical protein